MARQLTLSQIVKTQPAFRRSANIDLDRGELDSLPVYTFSDRSVRLLGEVLDSLEGTIRDRAWTVIGPYGSGKSLFALALSELANGTTQKPWVSKVLAGLTAVDPRLGERVNHLRERGELNLITVPVVGARMNLTRALTESLLAVCWDGERYASWVSESFASKVSTHAEALRSGFDDAKGTAQLFKQAAQQARTSGHQGLLVVIDEFGQFLEHAAAKEDSGNLIAVQHLAEYAARAQETELQLMTLLHQGMVRYASVLPEDQQTEWTKVQGRFREFAFAESPENQYQLIREFIRPDGTATDQQEARSRWFRDVWKQVSQLPPFTDEASAGYWQEIIPDLYPLHPLVVYALPRLAAIAGQNERTLFTFLASNDPTGLRAFLEHEEWSWERAPSLTLDRLYDYFLRGASAATLPADARRRISESEAALDRLSGDDPLSERTVRVLAVLSILERGTKLKPTPEALRAALDISDRDDSAALDETLDTLCARRLIVYREFSGEYRLWHGSDFEFESAFAHARDATEQSTDMGGFLTEEAAPRPVVARRHSFETGAVRGFQVAFITASGLEAAGSCKAATESLQRGIDGIIRQVIPQNHAEVGQAHQLAKRVGDPRLIVAVPNEPLAVARWTRDLAALRHIPELYPEVREDTVALRELQARTEYVEERLRSSFESLSDASDTASVWYWKGKAYTVSGSRRSNAVLSDICDELFSMTPIIRNELVNRDDVTSVVALAFKNIVGPLLDDCGEERAGLTGNGPEVSIFRTVFEDSELYRKSSGRYGLHRPTPADPLRLKPVWTLLQDRIKQAGRTDKAEDSPFVAMLEGLAAPPYGVRRGPAMLLLWAFLLKHRQEIALYYNGTFIPQWTREEFERFFHRPESFSARWFPMRGRLGAALRRLATSIPGADDHIGDRKQISVAEFLGHLYRWFKRLPAYASQTLELPEESVRLRRALVSAVDPVELLTDKLPEALGVASDDAEPAVISPQFEESFGEAVHAIQSAYPALMTALVEEVGTAFEVTPTVASLQGYFGGLEDSVIDRIRDSRTKAFFTRGRSSTLEGARWLESICAALIGQAPSFWNDHHREEFSDQLNLAVQKLRDAERAAFAAASTGTERWVRVLIESPSAVVSDVLVAPDSEANRLGALDRVESFIAAEVYDPNLRRQILIELLARAATLLREHPKRG